MYDMLTREQLSHLHELLFHVHQGLMDRMFGADLKPIIEVDGPDWRILKAKMDENSETMNAVYAEIKRRDQERALIILPHDEGTSYCTSIPGKCPVHDA